jgi:hypothetical protein
VVDDQGLERNTKQIELRYKTKEGNAIPLLPAS